MDLRRKTPEMPAVTAEASDHDLLAQYRSARSPEAFRRIIDRHGPMVLHTAQRLVGNRHDAEDVAQAVFLVFAQRAGSVSQTLGGWLHKVARDVSLQFLRAKIRRARREEAAVKPISTPNRDDSGELREEIDRVLVQLPDRLREAVVLRYLEGHGQEEAARMAGCDKGTLSRRCTDGLNRLGSLLNRRGVVVAPAVLAGFLSGQAAGGLSAATLNTLYGIGAGSVAASASAAGLAKGTLQAIFWVKAKLCVAVVVSLAAVGAVTPLVIPSSPLARQVLFRFDFEDGKRPAVCSTGKVVPGPERPGNRYCLQGGPVPDDKGRVFLQKEGGLFQYADDLCVVFDLWVDQQVSTVDLHFWDQTQQASLGLDPPLRVQGGKWIEGVVIRLGDFRSGSGGPRPGDVIASLAIQTGQSGGTIYVDNLEVVRLPKQPKN